MAFISSSRKTHFIWGDASQLFKLPKNLERGTGPSARSSWLLECFSLDPLFFSFFALLDLDLDLLDSLSSSSLLDESEEELEELESHLRLECWTGVYR
uniref:Uncharacterized protein LOC8286417 isoform X2 n=1 Tax=Rhizophora mucronata TaxID=61149 RepID=A0A2P2K8Q2_RHIMU